MALRTQQQVLKEQQVHLPLATLAHGGHCFRTTWEMSEP